MFKKNILAIAIIIIILLSATGVSAVSNLTDDSKNATVVGNASSGDCANITFETEGNNYESYCVEKGEDAPETGIVYTVEENLTSTGKITDEQAQKIKIFSIKYRNIDLTHNTINPKTGNPAKEIDDVTSRQLIIWDILGQADNGWYERNYVNKTIIDDIDELYNDGLRYDDKGFTPLNDTHQLNYIFKYFSSIESSLQDFLGWLFAESDIPPQENKTNTTNETEHVDNNETTDTDDIALDINDTGTNITLPSIDNDTGQISCELVDINKPVDNDKNNSKPIALPRTGTSPAIFIGAIFALFIMFLACRRDLRK